LGSGRRLNGLQSIGSLELTGTHYLPRLAIVGDQELGDIRALRPSPKHFLQERNRLGAVASSLVMPGEPNEELDMQILRQRANGSDKLTGRSPPAGRLSFDFV